MSHKSSGKPAGEGPRELSSALKSLRFMARKEEQVPSKSAARASENRKLELNQGLLPETTEPASSAFLPKPNAVTNVTFRIPLSVSTSSDAIREIRLRERLIQQAQSNSKKNSKKRAAKEQQELGRFSTKRIAQEEADDESDSSMDAEEVARFFAKNRKANKRN